MFEKSKSYIRGLQGKSKSAQEWNLLQRKFHLEAIRLNLALFKRACISHSAYMFGLLYHTGCVDRIDEQIRSRHFTLLKDCY
jgi:hypothetical protein